MSHARKVAKPRTMCPSCGEERSFDGVYCFSCGKTAVRETRPGSNDSVKAIPSERDIPARASYLFVSDGLLFSQLWYIPVSLIVLTAIVVALTQLHAGLLRDMLVGILILAEIGLIAWIMIKKRDDDDII